MKLHHSKDGGPKSRVEGWFAKSKAFVTLALLKFHEGTREAYHSHAFDCISLILGPGRLEETFLDGRQRTHRPGKILITLRSDFHQVRSVGTTYVLTLRGPWSRTWLEQDEDRRILHLTHGRRIVERGQA